MEMESLAVFEGDVPAVDPTVLDGALALDEAPGEAAVDGAVEAPGETPAEEAQSVEPATASADDPVPAEAELSASPEVVRLAGIVEGLLFAAGAPVALPKLSDALQGPSKAEIAAALKHLAARLEDEERGIRLVQVAGAYQLRSATVHGPWIRRLLNAKPPRLSRPMLETVAIVAYRQPCTRIEIESIRGVDADAALTTLMERRMVRMVGRKEAPGRPILYGTTREFLEVFGLPDIGALPPLPELAETAALLAAADMTVGSDGVHPTVAADAEGQAEAPVEAEVAAQDAAGEAPAAALVEAETVDGPLALELSPVDTSSVPPAAEATDASAPDDAPSEGG